MSVVDLSGKVVDAVIPLDDTPRAVLEKLLAEIYDGTKEPIRIVIAVETKDGYFNRSSRMTNSEAVTLTTIATRLAVDSILDV
jgi:hypothetical protein